MFRRGMGLILVLLTGGCTMMKLQGDLEQLDRHTEVSGRVVCRESLDDVIFVVMWSLDEEDQDSYWLTRLDSEFTFLKEQGRYYLMAFADANEDGVYQRGLEWGGVYDAVVQVDSGSDYRQLEIELLPPQDVVVPPEVTLSARKRDDRFALRQSMVGEITTLKNPLFTSDNGSKGLWTPMAFAEEIGVRIYFLEEYDPAKIPVLFVHGAGGYPGTWKTLVESLDRERYQPWVAFYPSGLRLEMLGSVYVQFLDELQLQYGIEQFCVVAHSMGGLMSHSMLQQYARLDKRAAVPVFISIASPWAGHTGVRAGVRHAPAVVPSWYDMVPESSFLQGLAEIPLSEETEHYLFFAYDGRGSIVPKHVNNDGTVTIRSQLHEPIQDRARRVIGIDANHVGILSNPETVKWVQEILSR